MNEKDKYNRIYANQLRYDEGGLYGSLCHGAKVIDHIDQLEFSTILDIGCGRGQFAKLMVDRGKQTFAIDISDALIDQLGVPGVEFKSGPMSDIPYDRTFDLVTAFEVLEHIPEPRLDQSLLELCRVTGRCAVVSIAFHNDIKWNMQLHMIVQSPSWWFDKLHQYFLTEIIRQEDYNMFLKLVPLK